MRFNMLELIDLFRPAESSKMNRCKYCKSDELVLSTMQADFVCEGCGEWQDLILDEIYAPIGYK